MSIQRLPILLHSALAFGSLYFLCLPFLLNEI